MNHTESSVKIFFTREYGTFRIINGNRQLSEAKIKRIRKDINSGLDVLKYCPIIVVEKGGHLDIIDGQHRFYVAKQLGSHVWYIIADELTLQEIAKINSNTEKWKDADFINCYVQLGNKNYEQLQAFMDETGFPLSISLNLLSYGTAVRNAGLRTEAKNAFRGGQYVVKEYEAAMALAREVLKFKSFRGHNSGHFIEAISRIVSSGKIDLDDIHSKWEENKELLKKQSTAKDYLVALEIIANKGAKIRRVIY